MNDYTALMVRNRLQDLPLQDEQGNPKVLPDDAIDFLMGVVGWAAAKDASDALEAVLNEFNLDDEDKDELVARINQLRDGGKDE